MNFDVFLCHNSQDKPAVRTIAEQLVRSGLNPWFDEWQLRPGLPWQDALEEQVEEIGAAAVLVGSSGLGPWQSQEQKAFLAQFVERNCPVIPVILSEAVETPKLPVFLRAMTWVDFRKSDPDPIQQLIWGITGRQPPGPPLAGQGKDTSGRRNKEARVVVPDLPPNFLKRSVDLDAARQRLLASSERPVGTTAERTVGLYGMGGVGKTVLATALARDAEIRGRFIDGVLWVTVGQNANILQSQFHLSWQLGSDASFADIQEGKDRLRELLKDKESLLILDDVWQVDAARALDVVGQRGRTLLTTRDGKIITALGADECRVDVLPNDQARELLREWSGQRGELSDHATDVARECGNLPLALSICGAMARDGVPWADLKGALQEADLGFLEGAELSEVGVFQSLAASIELLKPDERERYLELAVFPADESIPEAPVFGLWERTGGLSQRNARRLLGDLERKSLLKLEKTGFRTISLHDLQHDFLRVKMRDAIQELQSTLLSSYQQKCTSGWPSGPNDGYFHEHLGYHLKEAGRDEELKELLVNFVWLETKLHKTSVVSILSDFSHQFEDEDVLLLHDAIRLSAHVLSKDKMQLRSQLQGRLVGIENPRLRSLLSQLGETAQYPWFCSISAALDGPGGSLLRTLAGHSSWVVGVAVTPDGKRVISASHDRTLKVWELESGEEVHTLAGYFADVRAVAVTPDGSKAISADSNGNFGVWDLESGEELRRVEIPGRNLVDSVAITFDGSKVVAASRPVLLVWDLDSGEVVWELGGGEEARKLINEVGHPFRFIGVAVTPENMAIAADNLDDGTLTVWDLKTGAKRATLDGHSRALSAVAVTPDGKRVISASYDRTLKVWELESGEELTTLEAHAGSVNALAVTPDGERAISALNNNTLKVWELGSGEELTTFDAHAGSVKAVAVTPDGKIAVSGSEDTTLKVWDLELRMNSRNRGGHSGEVETVAVLTGGGVAISAGWQTLKVWDFEKGEELRTLSIGNATAVTPDGSKAISAGLQVWDLESGAELASLSKHTNMLRSAVAVRPDGRYVVASRTFAEGLEVWDLESGEQFDAADDDLGRVDAIWFTPDGSGAICGTTNGFTVLDIASGMIVSKLIHTGGNRALAVTPDGERAISTPYDINDNTLKVWDLESGEEVCTLAGHLGPVAAAAVSSHGRTVVSASRDGTLKLWDVTTGNCVATFAADHALTCCAASEHGETFICGDASGRVHFLRLCQP